MSILNLYVPDRRNLRFKSGDLVVSRNNGDPHKPFYLLVEEDDTPDSWQCLKISTKPISQTRNFDTEYKLVTVSNMTPEYFALSTNGIAIFNQ